jgi:hypothetical protein
VPSWYFIDHSNSPAQIRANNRVTPHVTPVNSPLPIQTNHPCHNPYHPFHMNHPCHRFTRALPTLPLPSILDFVTVIASNPVRHPHGDCYPTGPGCLQLVLVLTHVQGHVISALTSRSNMMQDDKESGSNTLRGRVTQKEQQEAQRNRWG